MSFLGCGPWIGIFQRQKVIFDEFQTDKSGWRLLSIVIKSYNKCQLPVKFWLFFVSCQKLSWPFVICHLTPGHPNPRARIFVLSTHHLFQEIPTNSFLKVMLQCPSAISLWKLLASRNRQFRNTADIRCTFSHEMKAIVYICCWLFSFKVYMTRKISHFKNTLFRVE